MKFLALVCLIVAVSARPQPPTGFQSGVQQPEVVPDVDADAADADLPVNQEAPVDQEELNNQGRPSRQIPQQDGQENINLPEKDNAELPAEVDVEKDDEVAPVNPNKKFTRRQAVEEPEKVDGADEPAVQVDAEEEEEEVKDEVKEKKPFGQKNNKRQAEQQASAEKEEDDDDKKEDQVNPVKPVALPAAVDRNAQKERKRRQDDEVAPVAPVAPLAPVDQSQVTAQTDDADDADAQKPVRVQQKNKRQVEEDVKPEVIAPNKQEAQASLEEESQPAVPVPVVPAQGQDGFRRQTRQVQPLRPSAVQNNDDEDDDFQEQQGEIKPQVAQEQPEDAPGQNGDRRKRQEPIPQGENNQAPLTSVDPVEPVDAVPQNQGQGPTNVDFQQPEGDRRKRQQDSFQQQQPASFQENLNQQQQFEEEQEPLEDQQQFNQQQQQQFQGQN